MSEREGGKREGGGQSETRGVGTDSSTETEMLEAAHSTSGVPSRALVEQWGLPLLRYQALLATRALVAGASGSTAGPLLHNKALHH